MNNASPVETLLFAALEKSNEADRAAFLDSACGGDAELRGQVEKLLKAHADVGDFLQKPVVEQLAGAQESAAATQALDPSTDHHKGGTLTRTVGEAASADDNSDLGFLQPSSRPDSLGRLGHYEALQVLGKGGFGIVFRAFDEILQRVVALKVLAPQLAATSPARRRFLREARSSAQVRHENVVQVYAVEEQPLPYLAMEFIPGETLQQKLDRVGPLDVPETLRIGRQIAEGLAAAHATDLIHRDIKPGNVLLEGGQHKVKITDFGLARAADDASISQSGIIAGTPMYMAPEQAEGQTLDQRADLFSLGSVLYQMVAGRPPFRANTTVAVLKRVAEDKPRAIREIIPETPQWLCDIIAKLHAKDPDDRYQSAREVADVLADCEAQLKANAKLKDFSRIPQSKRVAGRPERRAAWRKPAVFAAALLLPVVALALTEIAGITHLLPKQQPTPGHLQSGDQPKDNGPPTDFTNTLGMKFKLIPAGKFTMGSPKKEIDRCLKQFGPYKENLPTEGPEHPVEITQPFYLGATEVTVGQFRQFVDEEAYQVGDGRWRNPRFDQTDQHPVVFVSWNNAVDFCKWLSAKEGKEYRLPTEAEWEYSCRAGKAGSRYGFGDDDAQLENYAWFDQNSGGGTHPVGKKKPNAWGLYDMHGNAWEWCQDNYDPDYYKNSPVKDPPGGAGGARAGRGGGWLHGPVLCRSAFRGYLGPDDHVGAGFRVLLVSPPAGVGTETGTKNKPAVPAIAPFDAAQARAHQEASAKRLGVQVETSNTIGMKLRFIPPGKFTMGSSKEEIDFWLKQNVSHWKGHLPWEGPQHEVEITQPFYMGQTEVTVGQFRQFVKATGYKTQAEREGGAWRGFPDEEFKEVADTTWLNPGFAQTDDHPVVCVSWNDAVEFCQWLSKEEGKTYRLPTEAEWEYSCRAGSKGRWSFGDNEGELWDYARVGDNSQKHSWPVAGLKRNAWGLYDMHGNVAEWCQEAFDPNYYKTSPPKDPPGPAAGDARAIRGGSWLWHEAHTTRSAMRYYSSPARSANFGGFRVVLVVSPAAAVRTESGAKDAKEAQETSAKQLGIPVEKTNSVGMKLRFIPPGKFMMGSSREEIDFWLKQNVDQWSREQLPGEGPQHEVEITQPFYLGQTEVTVGQFRQFVKAQEYETQAEQEGGGYRRLPNGEWQRDAKVNWLNPGFAQTDDHPVVCVTWNDAVEFCNWLSKQEGKDYRLPTEAEWEYGCRAGSQSRWCFGDNEGELWEYARIIGNSQGHPWPVAELKANAWGLHDMHGNVWEFCQDLYDPNYYKTSLKEDPPGGVGGKRVSRGGSWESTPVICRSARRGVFGNGCSTMNGFRVVLVVSSPKTKTPPLALAPFTDADVQRIAALPAAQQVEEVRKELKRRNPRFLGWMEPKIEGGVVTQFRIVSDKVTDIAPIRVWGALRVLDCSGTWTYFKPTNIKPNGLLADLTPLAGMNLAALKYLNLSSTKMGDAGMVYFKDCKNLTSINLFFTQVSDAGLVHFKDCKALTHLYLGRTNVSDAGLANFKDCKNLTDLWVHDNMQVGDAGMVHFQGRKALTSLNLAGTKVSDAGLAHFKDCKNLKHLYVDGTQVGDAGLGNFKGMRLLDLNIDSTAITDLTPLQGMPLEHVRLTPKNITRGLDILRDVKSLKTIGIRWRKAWPAAEFWERYDKGEFK